MDEVYMQSQVLPAFDGYKVNIKNSIARYERKTSEPIKCNIGVNKMSKCTCGGTVVLLAYTYEDNTEKSNILLGKKCIECGNNYFTEKTILRFPKGFYIEGNKNYNKDAEYIKNKKVLNNIERYRTNIRKTVYDVYEQIFLLSYDKGLNLYKTIQDVSCEIDALKKEKVFEYEPEGYCGLWMVQSMADKLHIPVSQLFIQDLQLKNRIVEDIIYEASIRSKDFMDINFADEKNPKEGVQIKFLIKKINSCSTRQDVNKYCVELTDFNITNKFPNDENVFSEYLIKLCKSNGIYSIYLSSPSENIQGTSYIYDIVEIYSEKHGKLESTIEKCIEIKLNNVSKKNKQKSGIDHEGQSNSHSSITTQKKGIPMETKGRELPKTEIDSQNETELVTAVYNTTRTIDILNKFEGLEGNNEPYKRLVISNGIYLLNGYWAHYVIERSQKTDYVGDITFTNFKRGRASDLRRHVEQELENVNVEDYIDKDIFIKFSKPFHLRAQNKNNRTGYGWEWNWSGGYRDYTEGTFYGETTDYIFAGVYISSCYLYEQNKRGKIQTNASASSINKSDSKHVHYYKLVVDGYVKGEYTLVVYSGSLSFKSKNKRVALYIKTKRKEKDKYIPVACDTTDKLLYMDRRTFDCYWAQINIKHPLILHKTYIE